MVLSQLLLSLQTLHSSPDARQDKEQDQVSARVPKGKTHSRCKPPPPVQAAPSLRATSSLQTQ